MIKNGEQRKGESAKVARIKPPYDIRDQIQDSELDAESVQSIYDDINRMVILIGDIPFKRLLLTPIVELVPELLRRLDELERYKLIRDRARVNELARALVEQANDFSVASFYAVSRWKIPLPVQNLLLGLRREGIRVPLPNGGAGETKARDQVIKRLVKVAPELTFKQYHTVAKKSLSRATRNALAFARLHAFLGWGGPNDRCCDHDRFTKLGYCRPKEGSFCALALDPPPTEKDGRKYGFCTDQSTECG